MFGLKELYWAAGFLEGEGCFGHHNGYQYVDGSQKQEWPLRRLQKLFGGHIMCKQKAPFMYCWRVYGTRARGIVMTLYPLLSPRRQATIREALQLWKAKPNGTYRQRLLHRDEILAEYDNGVKIFKLCKKYNIQRSRIHDWLKKRPLTS